MVPEHGLGYHRRVGGSLTSDAVSVQAQGFSVRIARVPSQKEDRERIHVEMEKTRPDPLPLDLELDHRASFNLGALTGKRYADFAWGYRSVFGRRASS